MKKKDLAHQIRQVYLTKNLSEELRKKITNSSDDDVIHSEISCPCCGESQVEEVELIHAINEAKNLDGFLKICNEKAVNALIVKDKARKEDWEELKHKNTGHLIELTFDNVDTLIEAYFYEHKKHNGYFSLPLDKNKCLQIINKCNNDLYQYFDLGEGINDVRPYLKEYAAIEPDDFVAYEVVQDVDPKKVYPLLELKNRLISEAVDIRFRSNAFYCHITFTPDIFDYIFAGEQYKALNEDKSIVGDMERMEKLISASDSEIILLPELTNLIEKKFGDVRFLRDGHEFGRNEVILYWFLSVDEAFKTLSDISKWFEIQPYGKTVKHIGGHITIYDAE